MTSQSARPVTLVPFARCLALFFLLSRVIALRAPYPKGSIRFRLRKFVDRRFDKAHPYETMTQQRDNTYWLVDKKRWLWLRRELRRPSTTHAIFTLGGASVVVGPDDLIVRDEGNWVMSPQAANRLVQRLVYQPLAGQNLRQPGRIVWRVTDNLPQSDLGTGQLQLCGFSSNQREYAVTVSLLPSGVALMRCGRDRLAYSDLDETLVVPDGHLARVLQYELGWGNIVLRHESQRRQLAPSH